MSPTSEQESAVERLYENEALISNLTADVAQPVLQWAEQQILAGANAEAVYAAVRAVNQGGAQDATAALAMAQQTLTPTNGKDSAQPQPSAPVDAKPEVKPQSQETQLGDAAPTEPKPAAHEKPAVTSEKEQPTDGKPRRKTMRSFFQGWSKWLNKKRA
ncbi:MAG: hypothetical protein U0350_12115 [Caldilineaceae bacterium]